jgi:hypothetical protein
MSATTNSSAAPGPGRKWLGWVSSLLKSIWTFFPSLLFILLVIACFWIAGQGKDILVAYMEKEDHQWLGGATRIVFFIAIAFWVYVTWYSSRIIAYIKERQQQDLMKKASGKGQAEAEAAYHADNAFFEINQYFLDNFPRIGGNACLLVLELAILQSPALGQPIGAGLAAVLFFVLLVLLFFIDRAIRNKWSAARGFRIVFWVILVVFLLSLVAAAFPVASATVNAILTLGLLVLFHVLFLLYINLRRRVMEGRKEEVRRSLVNEDPAGRSIFERIMDYFCIPRVEAGYFKWYLSSLLVGVLLDWAAILYLPFARGITPFPMVILGFSVLLMLGNVITAFSVRYRINFHFIVFLLALFVSRRENHFVRTVPVDGQNNGYMARPTLRTYLTAWLNDRVPVKDLVPVKDSVKPEYDVYFVLSNGGASRSGYWTAAVLGSLEDRSIAKADTDRFSRHLFCLSGTSGGGVGVAAFFSMLKDQPVVGKSYKSSAADYLSQDYFTYTAARMLGPDYFHYIFPFGVMPDRGRALEHSLEASSLDTNSTDYRVPFADNLSGFKAMDGNKVAMPILFVNTTRMQDGNPGVVSNLNVKLDQTTFNGRVDGCAVAARPDYGYQRGIGSSSGGTLPLFKPGRQNSE